MYSRRQIVLSLASVSFAGMWPGSHSHALAASQAPVIAAAASLRFVLPDIAEAFERKTGANLRFSFASSGNLARQIRQGAPFELFLSADERFVLDLARDRITEDHGALYAEGRLAIFAATASPVGTDSALAGLRSALRSGELKRLAIANPEHAPYGRAARATLIHARMWEDIQPKLIFGENVSQAAQFAASASVDAALIALSIAQSPRFVGKGRFGKIPSHWHDPLRQRMVLLAGAGQTARSLYAFLQDGEAREIFARNGYARPDEARG